MFELVLLQFTFKRKTGTTGVAYMMFVFSVTVLMLFNGAWGITSFSTGVAKALAMIQFVVNVGIFSSEGHVLTQYAHEFMFSFEFF